ncbi:MAG: hypothetical protein CMF62_11880 [Magnetococcales bacterium]|jgi:hypothetical protein|nr:hypothetical protein [Magnetococcales bacterium]|tara:strand:- start:245819 stop:246046 length:228 start_codon:yes stop_codon:yes gene_type:complete
MFFLLIVPLLLAIVGIIGIATMPGITLIACVILMVVLNGWANSEGSGALALVPLMIVTFLIGFCSLVVFVIELFK